LRLAVPERRGPFILSTLVRLKDGVGVDAASKDLDRISQQLFSIWQQGSKDDSARLTPFPLHDIVVGDSAGFLWTAMSAVAVLLFIVLVNVANLLLMRMAQRNLEQRIRAAIGASRWRLAGTLIRENFVLSLLGGIGGILLAALLIGMFRSFGPALPRLDEVELNFTVLAFAGALVLGSACVLTLMPLLAGGLDVRTTDLQSRIQGSGRLGGRVRDGLVVVEFALALPLIIAAALLVDNLLRLQQVDPGFQTDHVLTMRVRLPEQGYADVPARLRLWERATSSFRSVAGVEAVGLAGTLPPACGCYNNFEVVGRPSPRGEEPQAPWVPVDAGFFQAGRLRLLEGRLFNASDTPDSAPVVIVSEAWSKRYLPGEQAIGRQLYEGGDRSDPVTIIGLVSDARFDGLENAGVTVFAPVSQGWGSQQLYVVARTSIDPLALAAPLQSSLRRLDPQLVPSEVGTLDRLVADSLGQQRHWATVIAAFATSALCLAAMGVFAVLAYQVSQRQREIGIRQAIGADATNIMHLVLWRGLRCALLGLLAGSVIAVFLTRALEFLLTQIQRSDPGVWLGAWALLLMVAGIACWLPARRASRLDPLAALRHD
jgi:predicted permease